MSQFYTITMPVISTGHISLETCRKLEEHGDKNPWTVCAPYDEGFFLYAQKDKPVEGTPADLVAVMTWARSSGYEWVRLDMRSGDVIDDLPQYDW
ncbi:hypothetical protein [Paraburkholderia sp.]|uniref:DUF5983 family protein n=1 Tax=Paraburkholderia sp. TaxID=1926495 RepID=UPI0039E35BBF